MRKFLLAAVLAVAVAPLAPAANAACAESHGGTAHVHSRQCGSFIFQCPLPSIHTTLGVGFECD